MAHRIFDLCAAWGSFGWSIRTLSWDMWDIVSQPGIRPELLPVLGVWSLTSGPPGKSLPILIHVVLTGGHNLYSTHTRIIIIFFRNSLGISFLKSELWHHFVNTKIILIFSLGLVAQRLKRLPPMWETWV